MSNIIRDQETWPDLPLEDWQDTCTTLHMWLQIIGKIRIKLAPLVNHWWQAALYVTSRGLTTSPIPYQERTFQIDLDFIDHVMLIAANNGETRSVELKSRTVADFYRATMEALRSLGIEVAIWTTPVEVQVRIPFERDNQHSAYDPEYAQRFWRVLAQTDRVLKQFRSLFMGKASPVQFFWGSFDLAATRFSGRTAPAHPGSSNIGRFVMLEAYSHEVSSCGFWPGEGLGQPAFYAYAYPEPAGFKEYRVQPEEAYYDKNFGEFMLPYSAVRSAASPDEKLLRFAQSTYEAAANTAHWDRASLERQPQTLDHSLYKGSNIFFIPPKVAVKNIP